MNFPARSVFDDKINKLEDTTTEINNSSNENNDDNDNKDLTKETDHDLNNRI